MEERQRLETTPFVTEKTGEFRKHGTYVSRRRYLNTNTTRRKEDVAPTSSIIIKIAICAGACALVLLLKWIDTPFANTAINGVRSAVTEESELDEMLGKLKFVELPQILDVFSNKTSMMLPVKAVSYEVMTDGRILKLQAEAGSTAVAPVKGMVLEIGIDAELGNYVAVKHADNMQTSYYGLKHIAVEQGQPVDKLDTLGVLDDGGTLYFAVMVNGEYRDPGEYVQLGD